MTTRRSFLKLLAAIPAVFAVGWKVTKKTADYYFSEGKEQVLRWSAQHNVSEDDKVYLQIENTIDSSQEETIRVMRGTNSKDIEVKLDWTELP